jgi:hypothetical protein
LAVQKAYVTYLLGFLNDLDNVIYEVANEVKNYSTQWQYEIINHIKSEEASKPKRHLVGMTGFDNIPHSDLANSPADWISPSNSGGDYKTNPPQASTSKIIIIDTDHLWGEGGDTQWVWKSFMRGLHPIFMDRVNSSNDILNSVSIRSAMGQTKLLADRLKLSTISPRQDLSSSGYCLTDLDSQWVFYTTTTTSLSMNLKSTTNKFNVEWINPINGTKSSGGQINGGDSRSITPPYAPVVLNLIKVTLLPAPINVKITN